MVKTDQVDENPGKIKGLQIETPVSDILAGQEENCQSIRHPQRDRKSPQYLKDYECKVTCGDDTVIHADHSYRANFKMKGFGRLKHFLAIDFRQRTRSENEPRYWRGLKCLTARVDQLHVNKYQTVMVIENLLTQRNIGR